MILNAKETVALRASRSKSEIPVGVVREPMFELNQVSRVSAICTDSLDVSASLQDAGPTGRT